MANQGSIALYRICKSDGSGDEKEARKILDEDPSLINEVKIIIII